MINFSGYRFLALVGFIACCSLDAIALEPIRVLSIDGGGVRGIIPAVILENIENELQKPASEIFDLVAGTSTGGLIALALAAPNHLGKPSMTAHDLVSFYIEQSPRIFYASLSHTIRTLGGLLGPKYESTGLQEVLYEHLGDTKLSEALVPTLITGYHTKGQTGIEFFSPDAKIYSLDRDCLMREVGLATAAAPIFFDSVNVQFAWGTLDFVVDGALYKHNPAILAYLNAKELYPDRKIEVYSLGTGLISAEALNIELKGRGLLQWLMPIISHIQVSSSEADSASLHRMLNHNGEENYFRLNIRLDEDHKKMDDTSTENLEYLWQQGRMATKTPIFRRMLAKLKQS